MHFVDLALELHEGGSARGERIRARNRRKPSVSRLPEAGWLEHRPVQFALGDRRKTVPIDKFRRGQAAKRAAHEREEDRVARGAQTARQEIRV